MNRSTKPGVRAEDFAFTVHVGDEDWHTYYFEKDGKKGTMAFAQRDGKKIVIGVFCAGKLTMEEAAAKIDGTNREQAL